MAVGALCCFLHLAQRGGGRVQNRDGLIDADGELFMIGGSSSGFANGRQRPGSRSPW